jgi:tRNA threonylcarbamoyladenosine biosynthesis protein TsaE
MTILEKLKAGITTHSAEETRALAAELAAALPPDSTLALHGDMGAGKTTFVQGLAHGLGVHDQVTSPTFAIYTVHRGTGPDSQNASGSPKPDTPGRSPSGLTLVHLDAYRLERESQIEDLLLDEFLISPWILAVEWPEKVAGWLPPSTVHLSLAIVDGDRHRMELR